MLLIYRANSKMNEEIPRRYYNGLEFSNLYRFQRSFPESHCFPLDCVSVQRSNRAVSIIENFPDRSRCFSEKLQVLLWLFARVVDESKGGTNRVYLSRRQGGSKQVFELISFVSPAATTWRPLTLGPPLLRATLILKDRLPNIYFA